MYTELTRQVLTVTSGSRQLVDLSSFVTSGSTGVSLLFDNAIFGDGTIGACHPSQTTMRVQAIKNHGDTMAFVGINGDREVSIEVEASVAVYLIGEFDSEAEFLTSDVDKTPGSTNTWTTTSHSETTTATHAIYNVIKSGDPDVGTTGIRNGDSTDTATSLTTTNGWAIHSLNSSFETGLYVGGGYSFYLVGFIDAGATAVEPAVDKSTATTGSWETVTPTTGTPEYQIIQYRGTSTVDASGDMARLREPSSSDVLGNRPVGLHTAIVKCDGSGNIEQWVDSADYDFWVVSNVVAGAAPSGNPWYYYANQ